MKKLPREDRASFSMRALAVSMFATASHQRRSPDSILKISREGAIAVHLPFWDTSFYQVSVPQSVPFETVVPHQLFGNAASPGAPFTGACKEGYSVIQQAT